MKFSCFVRSLLLYVFVVTVFTAFGQSAKKNKSGNPVFEGWYADPEVAVFGKEFWIYPTFSARYEKQVFFDAFSSKDLVNWSKHSRILDTASIKWAKRAMWAPAAVAKDGKYYLFFAANDIQSDNEYGGIGVAVADNPAGPFKDYLGKPLIDKFHNGAQPIDQFIFKDKDGAYYIFYGGWRHCNIAKLNDTFTGFIPFEDGSVFKEVTPEGYVEGPFMFVREGKYYFMWSEARLFCIICYFRFTFRTFQKNSKNTSTRCYRSYRCRPSFSTTDTGKGSVVYCLSSQAIGRNTSGPQSHVHRCHAV
jgi:beta-xylosidase